ncbi:MAG: small multi-drug export protein [Oscillibacter sp.]|nr:small multi-drug export protein [Oscillibacter sp.]
MPFLETMMGKLVFTAAIAMIPVVELRGAIPAGVAAGLSPWLACAAAIVGNLIPVPMIVLTVRQIFDWLKKSKRLGPRIENLERRAHLKGRVVKKYRLLGLVLLVAIPLPGTGAWTGALVAALLNIRLRTALPAILLGLVIAGAITTAVTMGVVHLL